MSAFSYPPRPCCPHLNDVVDPAAPRPAYPVHRKMDAAARDEYDDATASWYPKAAGCAGACGWQQGLPARYRAPLATQPAGDNPGLDYDARSHRPVFLAHLQPAAAHQASETTSSLSGGESSVGASTSALYANRVMPFHTQTTTRLPPAPQCLPMDAAKAAALVACRWKSRFAAYDTASQVLFHTRHLMEMVMTGVARDASERVGRILMGDYNAFVSRVGNSLDSDSFPGRAAFLVDLTDAFGAHTMLLTAYFRALGNPDANLGENYRTMLQRNGVTVARLLGRLRPSVLNESQARELWSYYLDTVFAQAVARQGSRYEEDLEAHADAKDAVENVFEAVADAMDTCDAQASANQSAASQRP